MILSAARVVAASILSQTVSSRAAPELASFGEAMLTYERSSAPYGTTAEHSRRMLKKAVQQGRRRVETGGVPSGVR